MNVTSKTIETNKVELTITVTAEEFAKGLETAFEKVRKDVTVEGFRKGKIPRKMFEQKFGVEALYDDALNAVLPDMYTQAVEEQNIEPIDFPQWDVKEISKDGVVATATVWTKPTVELGEYKGLSVEPLSEDVTEEEIQAEIDKLAATQSEMIVKEGAAVDGDTAVIDFEGFRDGVAFEGGKGENHPLELGSNSFIPGFEEQVVGMAAGDEKDVNVTFPKTYHAADLAGQEVVFKVKAHEIKTRQLPVVNDDFIKELNREGIETLEAFTEDLKKNLTESKKVAAKNHLMNSVIEQAVANATFEVPEVMIENEISTMVNQLEQQYTQQGISMEMFLEFSGQTMESIREQMKPEAQKRVAQSLVVNAIVAQEGVEITDTDIEDEFVSLSEMYNMPVEQIKNLIPDAELLRQDIQSRKTIDMLVNSIK